MTSHDYGMLSQTFVLQKSGRSTTAVVGFGDRANSVLTAD